MRVVHPRLDAMGSQELPRCELIALLPLKTARIAVLKVEETAFRGVDQQLIRTGTFRCRVCVVGLVADLRGQGAVRTSEKAMLAVNLISPLVIIHGRGLRSEGVQPHVLQ